MQGGVQYEARYIGSLRATGAPFLLLDAGGFVGSVLSNSQYLKARYLLKSLGAIGYQIVNVGRSDASFGLDFLHEMEREHGFQFVSATVLDSETREPLFKPYVIKECAGAAPGQTFRVAITGFTLPDSPAPDAVIDLAEAREEGGGPAASPAAAGKGAAPSSRAPYSATPTPRVSPTPTTRTLGVWEPAPGHTEFWARHTPTPPPLPAEFMRVLEQREKSAEQAREEQMRALRERLKRPETDFGAAAPQVSASAPASLPASSPAAPAASRATTETIAAPPLASASAATSEKIEAPKPRRKEFVVADPIAVLSKLVPALRRRADFVVVLAHYPESNALAVVDKTPGIDLLISGYGVEDSVGPKKRGTTFSLNAGGDGRTIGRAKIAFDEASGRYDVKSQTVAINASLQADETVSKILAEYKEETKRLAPTFLVATRYTLAGAEICRSCHLDEYNQWSSTPHAQAMETLRKENQNYNPECIPCHVTYYNVDNGFRDIINTPQFANVQCEVCHGPSLRHMRDTHLMGQAAQLAEPQRKLLENQMDRSLPKKPLEEKMCLQCHTPENDDNFVYAAKIEKVRHKAQNVAQAPSAVSAQPASQPVPAARLGPAAQSALAAPPSPKAEPTPLAIQD
jgi:nitrate/TMAO reductase-like tetraheme cytochrome c subunit